MKEVEIIQHKINKLPKGMPFGIGYLAETGSYENVRQVLSRLVHAGKLRRASRGVYVKPKIVPYLGAVLPSAEEIIKTIAKQTGEVVSIHGAEAARQLQLTTQAPVKPIFNTSGSTREIKFERQTIKLKHIASRKQVMPGTIVCTVFSALWYLGKGNVNEEIIEKIKEKISNKQFSELLEYINKMPRWMASLFNKYKK